MKNEIVITSNLVRCMASIERLMSRDEKVEGMGLLYGLTGEGKTTAVTYVCNRLDAIYMRARSTWTPRTLLQSLVGELGLAATYSLDPMMQMAVDHLRLNRSPVFIDEADYLVTSHSRPALIDVMRDLYDETKVPVILIGSGSLERRLQTNSRLAKHRRRISQWIEFRGVTLEDAKKIVAQLAEVEVATDLVTKMFSSSQGNMGALIAAIYKVEEFAALNGLSSISNAEWQGRDLPSPNKHGFYVHDALV
jgi:DNA transposition AAA+ family ATPase